MDKLTLIDIMPYIEIVSNFVSMGFGILLGGLIFGGFMYGFKNND